MIAIDRIEAILSDLEAAQAACTDDYSQPSDKEAGDVVSRILRKLKGSVAREKIDQWKAHQ